MAPRAAALIPQPSLIPAAAASLTFSDFQPPATSLPSLTSSLPQPSLISLTILCTASLPSLTFILPDFPAA